MLTFGGLTTAHARRLFTTATERTSYSIEYRAMWYGMGKQGKFNAVTQVVC